MLETDEGVNFADKMAALRSAAGAELTTVTLEYRDVCVQAMAVVGSASIRTLGNVSMGLLRKAACQAGPKTQCVDILKNVSGVLRPGTVTLLLGPPGAGKSVFLQTLAGRLRQGPGVKITGDIKYNGKTQDEFVVRRTVALVDQVGGCQGWAGGGKGWHRCCLCALERVACCPGVWAPCADPSVSLPPLQLDYHIPSLTVLETCQFAFGCQTDMEAAAHFMALLDQVGRLTASGRRAAARTCAGWAAQASATRAPRRLSCLSPCDCHGPAQLAEELEREAALVDLEKEEAAEAGQVGAGSRGGSLLARHAATGRADAG